MPTHLQGIVWHLETPSLREELDRVDAALGQLPSVVLEYESYSVFCNEFYSDMYDNTNYALLNDVLHDGPSAVILEDAGRGWRLEVHAGAARTQDEATNVGRVTYRCVGSCRGQDCMGACAVADRWRWPCCLLGCLLFHQSHASPPLLFPS